MALFLVFFHRLESWNHLAQYKKLYCSMAENLKGHLLVFYSQI